MALRQALIKAAQSDVVERAATATPIARDVVRRYIAGERTGDAVRVAGELAGSGLRCTLNYLGEAVTEPEQAEAMVDTYRRLIAGLQEADLTDRAELSVKLSSIGLAFSGDDGHAAALENMRSLCAIVAGVGMQLTVDMEDHSTTDETLQIVKTLRADFPWVGVVLQAELRRTQSDCRDLSGPDSRVRLCKGAYGPSESAYGNRQEIDLAYVRCLKILMAGQGYPMLATHDPRLIEIATAVAVRSGRERGSYEFQMLYGIRPEEQKRLATIGERVRVYVPYGTHWYPWVMRRMAEKPSNMLLFAKSLVSAS